MFSIVMLWINIVNNVLNKNKPMGHINVRNGLFLWMFSKKVYIYLPETLVFFIIVYENCFL